jgi:hypothetical protein
VYYSTKFQLMLQIVIGSSELSSSFLAAEIV